MKKSMRSFCWRMILAVGISFTGACDSIEPSKIRDSHWELVPTLTSDLGIMNSSNSNDALNLIGPSSYYKNFNTKASTEIFSIGPYSKVGRLKFPVPDGFYVFTETDKITIRSTSTTEEESDERLINLKELDENFFELTDIPYWQGECVGLSESNHILVPYETVKDGMAVSSPYFVLARVSVVRENELEVEVVKVIKEDLFLGKVSVYSIQSFFDQFFVVIGNATFKIDDSGGIVKISDKVLKIIRKENLLFAFAYNQNTDFVEVFKSENQGMSWEFFENTNLPLTQLNFTVIDQEVVAFTKAQIFSLKFTESDVSIFELENEGLSLSDITSISKMSDNTVLLTTRCNSFSTVCGAYIKPFSTFFSINK